MLKGQHFKHTEEAKQKIKEHNAKYWLGKKRSQKVKDAVSRANKGKKASLGTRQKMSLSRMGENNPFWGKKHSLKFRLERTGKIVMRGKVEQPYWIEK